MRVFDGTLIEKIRKTGDMSRPGLLRAMSKVCDNYGRKRGSLKPSKQYLDRILNGNVESIGSLYMALFADILHCKTDDFFVTKPEKG